MYNIVRDNVSAVQTYVYELCQVRWLKRIGDTEMVWYVRYILFSRLFRAGELCAARVGIRDLHGITNRGYRGITAVKNRGNWERVLIFTAVAAVTGTAV